MKKTLEFIIQNIVSKPEAVEITEDETEGTVNFTVSVDKEDMGKVIGRQGKIIRAIRNVMKIPAIKQNKRIELSLIETS